MEILRGEIKSDKNKYFNSSSQYRLNRIWQVLLFNTLWIVAVYLNLNRKLNYDGAIESFMSVCFFKLKNNNFKIQLSLLFMKIKQYSEVRAYCKVGTSYPIYKQNDIYINQSKYVTLIKDTTKLVDLSTISRIVCTRVYSFDTEPLFEDDE